MKVALALPTEISSFSPAGPYLEAPSTKLAYITKFPSPNSMTKAIYTHECMQPSAHICPYVHRQNR